MNDKVTRLLTKLTNTKTIISLASLITLILTTLGYEVDNEKVMTIIKAVCSIGVIIGVLNDKGMETTEWDK